MKELKTALDLYAVSELILSSSVFAFLHCRLTFYIS